MKPSCLLVTTLALLSMLGLQAQSLTITNPTGAIVLAWNAVPSTNNVSFYKLYWGPSSANYTNVLNAGTNTTATVTNLPWGGTYYFAATAVKVVGTNLLESAFSNEVWTNTVPIPPPPTVLRVISN
jgi:Fibronectin type III domain